MCNCIKTMLEDIDYIIARLNSEVCLLPYEADLESCKFIFYINDDIVKNNWVTGYIDNIVVFINCFKIN